MAQTAPGQSATQGTQTPNAQSGGTQANQPPGSAGAPQSGPRPGAPQRPQGGPPPKSRGEQVRMYAAHPLLLLIIGALVTGILVPSVTQSWQRHQTAQDMKTQVVGEVTQSVSIPMAQVDVTQNPVLGGNNNPQASPASIAQTYFNFLTKSASTGSDVAAYFPENNIPTHWKNLVGLVHNFYLFTYATDPGAKQRELGGIKKYFDVHHIHTIDWNSLFHADQHSGSYRSAWITLEHLILDVRDQVTTAIMDAPAPSF